MLPDIERPLNKRGQRDAPFMANKLFELGVIADCLVSSPAVRARTTAEFFADAMGIPRKAIIIDDDIYGAGPEGIIEVVRGLNDKFRSVFLFGHNPTMTELANMFPGVDGIDNVPTCGILQAKTMVAKWEKWSPDVSAFTGFYYPKQYVQ